MQPLGGRRDHLIEERLGLGKSPLLVQHPGETVLEGDLLGPFGQGLANHALGLLELDATVRPGIAQVVVDPGVVGVELVHFLQQRHGLVMLFVQGQRRVQQAHRADVLGGGLGELARPG